MLPYLLTGAIAATLLVISERYRDGWGKRVAPAFKTIAALSFVGLGARAMTPGFDDRLLLFVGLALCAAGDVLLVKRGTGVLFKLGLGAFLSGHIAYTAAFLVDGGLSHWLFVALAPLAIVASLVGRWLARQVEGRLRIAIVVYLVVITFMVAAAASRALYGSDDGWLCAAAAFAFWLSDLFVARQRFVRAQWLNKIFGQPLYFGAQLALAASLWP